MSSFHVKQGARTTLRWFAALFIFSLLVTQTWTPAYAQVTTGILTGTVTDSATHAALADVKVTAVSPTGTYHATTDGHGFYSIAGVFADEYTVSFQLAGYEPVSVPGQNVFADLSTTVSVSMLKSLRTIAHITARSVGGAFQPTQTTDTYSITPHQIQTILGNQLNLSESTLITSLPGGSLDSSGYPVIRGGRENEENFEFEGIPVTDAFTDQFTNSQSLPGLGLQSAQLTPGVGNASQDNYGTGTFNLVAKRGTYPGYATGQFGIGGPAFQHEANIEYGWATPNGKLSAYFSLNANNQGRTYGGYLTSVNCQALSTCFSRVWQAKREFLGNVVFKFGRDNNQQLQLFTDQGNSLFYTGQWDPNTLCFKTCDPFFLQFAIGAASGNPLAGGTALSAPALGLTCLSPTNCPGYTSGTISPNVTLIQSLMNLQTPSGQTRAFQTLGSVGARPQTNYQPNHLEKIGYAWFINSSTFLEAMGYHQDSTTTFDLPLPGGYSATGATRFQLQGGKTSGAKLDLTSQLSDKNLLKAGGEWELLIPVFDAPPNNIGLFNLEFSGNNQKTGQGGELFDFVPVSSCPLSGAVGHQCGYIYTGPYINGSSVTTAQTVPNAYENTSVDRQNYAVYIDDTWSPNDRLKVEGGLRMDEANYMYPTPKMDLNTCTSLYLPTYSFDSAGNLLTVPSTAPAGLTPPQTTYRNPVTGATQVTAAGTCPVATFNLTKAMKNPIIPEPVFSATYRLGPNDSLRASWGRSTEFEILADADNSANPNYFSGPNGAFFNLPGYGTNCGVFADTKCSSYAEQLYWDNAQDWSGNPVYQPARPTVFVNADFSWEHQFTRGLFNGMSFKITPWYRKAQDEIARVATPKMFNGAVITDPNTFAILFNPPISSNQGVNQAVGIEAQFTKEQTYGLSGQVTFSYQNEFSSVIPLSGSEDFFPSIPAASVLLGNAYRVGFLSPFVASFDFSYQTHNGWRINPQVQWDIGYPISPGTVSSGFINGQPYNVPNTNASAALISTAGGTGQYVDPMNPGSFFKPNIAATRGIPMSSSPGGKLSAPASLTNLTIEYNAPKTWAAGIQIFNVFNNLFSGVGAAGGVPTGAPQLNSRWQQLATGISGPLTGQNAAGLTFPWYGMVGVFGNNRFGQNAYIDTPSGVRNYYVYMTLKL